MYLLLILSLAIIFSAICREMDRCHPSPEALTADCPDCGGAVESGWLSCPHCRVLLRTACSNCGQHHDRWDQFCPWCGSGKESRRA